jgi:hypothetical protein
MIMKKKNQKSVYWRNENPLEDKNSRSYGKKTLPVCFLLAEMINQNAFGQNQCVKNEKQADVHVLVSLQHGS